MEKQVGTRTEFIGFFSYAHHDAETDPKIISAFTADLENRVSAKLTNADFHIWRDTEGLRTGDLWQSKLEETIQNSDVLIILLTPKWIQSDFCRREYSIFEQTENQRSVGEYVVPVLVRSLKKQERHFTAPQASTYSRLQARQYQQALAVDFLLMSKARRVALLDALADDIAGMLDRRRLTPQPLSNRLAKSKYTPTKEFDSSAHNYELVDFVSDGEIVLNQPTIEGQRSILAHIGFIERLYVQGRFGRIEFGVRRAFLSIENHGPGLIEKVDELRGSPKTNNAYYTTFHEAPQALTVCINPPGDRTSLAELPLAPANGENFLSRIAVASADVNPEKVSADLTVSLNVEGLTLIDAKREISHKTKSAIKAIMAVANNKNNKHGKSQFKNGRLKRSLPVRERTK
jgi:TIR domain